MPSHRESYAAVIADLKAKRDEIDKMVKLLEALSQTTADSGKASDHDQDRGDQLPPTKGRYSEMSIADAALAVLKAHGRPLSNVELADELLSGGLLSGASNPANNVNSSLSRRSETHGDIVKDGRQWALREWPRVHTHQKDSTTSNDGQGFD